MKASELIKNLRTLVDAGQDYPVVVQDNLGGYLDDVESLIVYENMKDDVVIIISKDDVMKCKRNEYEVNSEVLKNLVGEEVLSVLIYEYHLVTITFSTFAVYAWAYYQNDIFPGMKITDVIIEENSQTGAVLAVYLENSVYPVRLLIIGTSPQLEQAKYEELASFKGKDTHKLIVNL